MKIKSGFVKHRVANRYVAVATGALADEFNGMIKLNETGSLIWDKIAEGCTLDQIVDALVAEYEIDRETATRDAQKLIDQLVAAGIVE